MITADVGAQCYRYHTKLYRSSWVVIRTELPSVWFPSAVATTGKPLTSSSLSYNVTCLRDNRTRRIWHGPIIKFHLHSMYYLFRWGNSFKAVVFIFGSLFLYLSHSNIIVEEAHSHTRVLFKFTLDDICTDCYYMLLHILW